ncbi:asparaginase [Naumannella halotolerans]|uniref:Asparaginase n=1 Tax=Naumannella halotolerans TaxID=993414 RepID=A0A4V3EMG2_9ACTN|nr:asparaginase [Naumannella halotolerans]TDT30018.1 asparaginase [Naumannella halotolerans]
MTFWDSDPVLLEVERGGLVESVHRGRLAITAADGTVDFSWGTVDVPIYPRSCLKPLQAVAMVQAGLDLDGELLALAAASHSGEAFHIAGAERILAGAQRGVGALQNPPDWPLDDASKEEWILQGRRPEAVAMNCSGKHAAMIRTCVRRGWDEAGYLHPDHPLQRAIAGTLEEWTGEQPGVPTVDGCGAPLFPVTLVGLARAFGRLAAADDGPGARVAEAIRQNPEWTSGTLRDENQLHRAIPGLVTKAGAEAVHAVGLPDGRGIALKIDDGGFRGRAALMAAALQRLGYDHPTLAAQRDVPVLGGGRPVGAMTVVGVDRSDA